MRALWARLRVVVDGEGAVAEEDAHEDMEGGEQGVEPDRAALGHAPDRGGAVEADHRMWWNPTTTDLPDFASLDQRYLETDEKFDRLKEIKTCVDPDDLFKNAMSIPTN